MCIGTDCYPTNWEKKNKNKVCTIFLCFRCSSGTMTPHQYSCVVFYCTKSMPKIHDTWVPKIHDIREFSQKSVLPKSNRQSHRLNATISHEYGVCLLLRDFCHWYALSPSFFHYCNSQLNVSYLCLLYPSSYVQQREGGFIQSGCVQIVYVYIYGYIHNIYIYNLALFYKVLILYCMNIITTR